VRLAFELQSIGAATASMFAFSHNNAAQVINRFSVWISLNYATSVAGDDDGFTTRGRSLRRSCWGVRTTSR
jgi:hypothetical protein